MTTQLRSSTLRTLLIALAGVSLLAVAGGYGVYRSQRDRLLRLELSQLVSIAETQAGSVANWRRERLGNVRAAVTALSESPLDALETEGEDRQHAIRHLTAICRAFGYRRAQVFDDGGRLLMTVDANGVARPESIPGDLFARTLSEASGALVEAERRERGARFVVLGRISPVGQSGVVALIVESGTSLFPTLGRSPVRRRSLRSYLALRDADGYRSLDTGDGSQGAPPALFSPAAGAARSAPAVAAELGVRAMSSASGAEVLAVTAPVEGTDWVLVAQIDRQEVDEPLFSAALRIAGGIALLLAATWSVGFIFWSRARARWALSLRERAEELRAVVGHAPDGIFLIDAEERIVEGNRSATELLGYTRHELVGRKLRSIVAPESLAENPLRLDALEEGEKQVVQHFLAREDGSRVHVELSASRLPDGRLIAFVRDTAERRALEDRMRLLSRALEESPAPALIARMDGRVEFANRRYAEVTGYDREEIPGHIPHFLDPEGTSHDAAAAILESARAGQEWEGELFDRRKSGEIFFWHLRAQPIANESGRIAHLLILGEDVSEQRRQRERFRLARRLVRMGVYEWDFQYRELWWSEEAFEVFGVDRERFQPHWESFFELIHPDDRNAVERAFQRAVEGGPQFDIEFRVRLGEGRERRIHSVCEVLRDGAGVPVTALGVALDVTGQRGAERALEEVREQLHRAQKMEALGRLAGGVAHDFNNLLGVIIGYSELLRKIGPPDTEPRRQVEEIHAAAEKAADLTRQLLTVGRRQAVQVRSVELLALLREVEPLLRHLLPENVELVIDLSPGLEYVQADPEQLRQVVLNLALNSRDAMVEGGRLTLTARTVELGPEAARARGVEEGRFAEIEIADTGLGMEPSVLERAFEPFFTTKSESGASGLGLATVYGIVCQLGGVVTLDSATGHGTAATTLLPCRPASTHDSGEHVKPEVERVPVRVLVVEDVAALGQMIIQMLAERGFDARLAETPARALDIVEEPGFEVDLLLTDLMLPGIDGRELARRMRVQRPAIKVVLMSGYSDLLVEGDEKGRAGADALLAKPFTGERLEQVLAHALGRDVPAEPGA